MCCSIIISTAILYHFYRFPIHLERRLLEISTVRWVWRTPPSRWRFARPNSLHWIPRSCWLPKRECHIAPRLASHLRDQRNGSTARKNWHAQRPVRPLMPPQHADARRGRRHVLDRLIRRCRQAPRRPTRNGIARSKLTPYQWPSSVALIASHTTSAASAAASSAVLPRRIAPEKTDA